MNRIYTDGACSGNPGRGGWAAILDPDTGETHEISGSEPATTNNRMELRAAIEALRMWPGEALVISDSQYLVNGAKSWLPGWKRKGWRLAKGNHPIKNRDLWEALDAEIQKRPVTWQWVRGHNGDLFNERCDRLANIQAGITPAHDEPAAVWREDLKTSVTKLAYDFAARTGTLSLPPLCCTDMTGAIALFQRIDPQVEQIETFAGGQRDTTYALVFGQWQARL